MNRQNNIDKMVFIISNFLCQNYPIIKSEIKRKIRKNRTQKGIQQMEASLTTLKPLTMWITTNCGKF